MGYRGGQEWDAEEARNESLHGQDLVVISGILGEPNKVRLLIGYFVLMKLNTDTIRLPTV